MNIAMLPCVSSYSQKGFILITVLLFLQIFILLGLYALLTSIVAKKISTSHWQQQVTTTVAESILHDIELKLSTDNMLCLIPVTSRDVMLSLPPVSATCSGNIKQFKYSYIVELLGQDPCAETADANPQPIIVDYFRISLLVIMQDGHSKIALQSVITKLNHYQQSYCPSGHHRIDLGRQMWREIYPPNTSGCDF
jgi:Tfp pilus assembly protein PilX